MNDLSKYSNEEFDADGVRPSDAATRAFMNGHADVYLTGGQEKIEFAANEFIAWYTNEIEVIKRSMLKRIYTELSK